MQQSYLNFTATEVVSVQSLGMTPDTVAPLKKKATNQSCLSQWFNSEAYTLK